MTDTFELAVTEDPVEHRELIAVAGFLAGYGTTTRTSYRTDLRIFTIWCHGAGLTLFDVKRAHLECSLFFALPHWLTRQIENICQRSKWCLW